MGSGKSKIENPPSPARHASFKDQRKKLERELSDALQRAKANEEAEKQQRNKKTKWMKTFSLGSLFCALYMASFKTPEQGIISGLLRTVDNLGCMGVSAAGAIAAGLWIQHQCLGPPKFHITNQAMNNIMNIPTQMGRQSAKENGVVAGILSGFVGFIIAIPLCALAAVFCGVLDVAVQIVPTMLTFIPVGVAVWVLASKLLSPTALFLVKAFIGRTSIFAIAFGCVCSRI